MHATGHSRTAEFMALFRALESASDDCPAEELDSDEVRNDDGDEVVDPPEEWIEAKDNETLDERLAEEVPDDLGDDEGDEELSDAHDSDAGGGLTLVSNYELDRMDPSVHGRLLASGVSQLLCRPAAGHKG